MKFLCLFLGFALAGTAAQAQTYTETFDSGPEAIMLNGGVEFGLDPPWNVRVADGQLVLSNSTDASAVRYYHIDEVRLGSAASPIPTTDATIQVVVTNDSLGRSAAGVIARYDARSRDYILFGVGNEGTYWTMLRTDGRAQITGAGTHPAIRVGQPNIVEARTVGDEVAFSVNGAEVVRLPTDRTPGRLVGIVAFGPGTFNFDNVMVSPAGAETGK